MKTPERTTAQISRVPRGEVLADSATLKWSGLFARRYRFPRVVDGFLVPATAEPLITFHLNGPAEFQERDIGGAWLLDKFGAETSSLRAQRPLTSCAGARVSVKTNHAIDGNLGPNVVSHYSSRRNLHCVFFIISIQASR